MKLVKYLSEELETGSVTIISTGDAPETIRKMFEHIKKLANVGHSFTIIVDPDGDESETFYIDGDGADYIKEIQ